MLSPRLRVRDFPLSSIMWVVPLRRGFSPSPQAGGPNSRRATAAGLGLCSHHLPDSNAHVCPSVSPMPMCVCSLLSGDPGTTCQLRCQQPEPQTQSDTLVLPMYHSCPAPALESGRRMTKIRRTQMPRPSSFPCSTEHMIQFRDASEVCSQARLHAETPE